MAERIRTQSDIDDAVRALTARDPRLARIAELVPVVPLRLQPAGLAGLLRIVAGQQLSTQSAAAVYGRVETCLAPLTAETILAASDSTMRTAGLSRGKVRTFRAVAEAVAGGLDLLALAEAETAEARAALEDLPGIGRWTADLYLMFCAGHPDIFPVGDLAVRRATQDALDLAEEPRPDALDAIAEAWAPHRSTAARLMWAYYRYSGAPATQTPTEAATAGFPL
ncbi:DNA-3-methyladenine glycosylase family protein [Acuticoccus mangrovi]|uniref:DNA-3-methyladenine glycosylase II n=1 Tax=Acuticoccus mangrovi TaxID=2796142 RepID=A0A934IJP7_9HYPH|nr:DNA-3-methyladenine glycosylase 2 family protein [Acuticoccus mangrovi]MBJ3777738.1 DNA-3-methyladenine glycosylase 2 family protein [Acuticoccus mangrovi]